MGKGERSQTPIVNRFILFGTCLCCHCHHGLCEREQEDASWHMAALAIERLLIRQFKKKNIEKTLTLLRPSFRESVWFSFSLKQHL